MVTTAERTETLASAIRKLAGEKNALILAHNYQREEVQAVADYTGDSLELARIAADTAAEIIGPASRPHGRLSHGRHGGGGRPRGDARTPS